jgi:endonuclease/exonuclease/phosphatase family metal-dependent hydrolase
MLAVSGPPPILTPSEFGVAGTLGSQVGAHRGRCPLVHACRVRRRGLRRARLSLHGLAGGRHAAVLPPLSSAPSGTSFPTPSGSAPAAAEVVVPLRSEVLRTVAPRALRVLSWNTHALFTTSGSISSRRSSKNVTLRKLGLLCDVLFLQEVHGGTEDVSFLATELPQHTCFSSFGDSPSAGGVVTAIRHQILRQLPRVSHHVLVPGRVFAVRLSGLEQSLLLLNFHIVPDTPSLEARRIFNNIAELLKPFPEEIAILAGDVNFGDLCDNNSRLQLTRKASFTKALPHLIEICQPMPTHAVRLPSGEVSAARLDRAWVNLPAQLVLDLGVRSSTWGSTFTNRAGSDHCPIQLLLPVGARIPSIGHARIPAWLARSAAFKKHLEDLVPAVIPKLGPAALADFAKNLFRKAASMAKRELRSRSPKNNDEKLFWAIRELRLWASGGTLDGDLPCRWAPVASCREIWAYDKATATIKLNAIIASLRRACSSEDAEEAPATQSAGSADSPNAGCAHRLSLKALWTSRGASISLAAVVTHDGSIAEAPALVAAELAVHWQKQFAKQPVRSDLWPRLQPYIAKLPADTNWDINKELVASVLKSRRNTAPGPDGVPICCWQAAGDFGVAVLWALVEQIMLGTAPPKDFGDSLLTFLAKGSDDPELGIGTRTCSETRPISLINCDAKVVTLVLVSPLLEVGPKIIDRIQHGGVRGRLIFDSIFTLEANMIAAARAGGEDAGVISLDFATAFPSVASEYILYCLEQAGLPCFVVNFFRHLYNNTTATTIFQGARSSPFKVGRGVRQGCPASMFIFVFALQAFTRYFQQVELQDRGLLLAYADDLVIATKRLSLVFPALCKALQLLASTTGLKIKVSKCQVLLLSRRAPGDFLKWACSIDPDWAHAKVQTKIQYLGIAVGLDAARSSWSSPLAKYLREVKRIHVLGLGLLRSTLLHNLFAFSCLQYVASLFAPGPEVCLQVREAQQLLTHGPRFAWSPAMLTILKDFSLGANFKDIRFASLALRWRTSLASSTFEASLALARSSCLSDDMVCDNLNTDLGQQWWLASSLAAVWEGAEQLRAALGPEVPLQLKSKLAYDRLLANRGGLQVASNFLLKRLTQWHPKVSRRLLGAAIGRLARVRQLAGAAIVLAPLKIATRGVVTSSRFGTDGLCPMGCCIKDDVHHLVRCSALLEIFCNMRAGGISLAQRLGHMSCMLRSVLLLRPFRDEADDLLLVVCADIIIHVHARARRAARHPPDARWLRRVAAARLRCLCRRQAAIAHAVAQP